MNEFNLNKTFRRAFLLLFICVFLRELFRKTTGEPVIASASISGCIMLVLFNVKRLRESAFGIWSVIIFISIGITSFYLEPIIFDQSLDLRITAEDPFTGSRSQRASHFWSSVYRDILILPLAVLFVLFWASLFRFQDQELWSRILKLFKERIWGNRHAFPWYASATVVGFLCGGLGFGPFSSLFLPLVVFLIVQLLVQRKITTPLSWFMYWAFVLFLLIVFHPLKAKYTAEFAVIEKARMIGDYVEPLELLKAAGYSLSFNLITILIYIAIFYTLYWIGLRKDEPFFLSRTKKTIPKTEINT